MLRYSLVFGAMFLMVSAVIGFGEAHQNSRYYNSNPSYQNSYNSYSYQRTPRRSNYTSRYGGNFNAFRANSFRYSQPIYTTYRTNTNSYSSARRGNNYRNTNRSNNYNARSNYSRQMSYSPYRNNYSYYRSY